LLPVIIELATLCAILQAGLESSLFLMYPAIKLERLLGGDARIGTISSQRESRPLSEEQYYTSLPKLCLPCRSEGKNKQGLFFWCKMTSVQEMCVITAVYLHGYGTQ
jgi:uracil phosphoribosyltransferase